MKEGKGGQRDLQTLFWIAKYYYRVGANEALVDAGLLSRQEYSLFLRCSDFLWAVRCHLHFITGRAEERLSFDLQPELARQLGYQKHPGLHAAERFMKHYFLVAKDVGDLTRIVCAELEEREAKNAPRLNRLFRGIRSRRTRAEGLDRFRGRARAHQRRLRRRVRARSGQPHPHLSRGRPERHRLPSRRAAAHHASRCKRIDRKLQHDPEANRLFLEILCDPDDAEAVLRHMNEAGVLGRFIPDFGKIVAMMQFNMYHHYTVDEHLIRAIGCCRASAPGGFVDEHPLSAKILPSLKDLTVLTVALFLHDIAKGRPEDHSIAGAKVARKLCPRLGLNPPTRPSSSPGWSNSTSPCRASPSRATSPTAAPSWILRRSCRRPERLKLLLVLTVCDIRAVGPGVWNGWKGQLLRALYYETEPILTGGFSAASHAQRLAETRAALAARLAGWPEEERNAHPRPALSGLLAARRRGAAGAPRRVRARLRQEGPEARLRDPADGIRGARPS